MIDLDALDAVEYMDLVAAESKGLAEPGTAQALAADPFRWAAALGCIIGDICQQIDAAVDPDPAWLAGAIKARRYYTARKAEVVAIRKRTAVSQAATSAVRRADRLASTLRQIRDMADQHAPHAAIAAAVDDALARPGPSPQDQPARGGDASARVPLTL